MIVINSIQSIMIAALFFLSLNGFSADGIFEAIDKDDGDAIAAIAEEHEYFATLVDEEGFTPLFRAVKGAHFNAAKKLLELGHDPDARNSHDQLDHDVEEVVRNTTPLFYVVTKPKTTKNDLKFFDLLIEHGANPKQQQGGYTPRTLLMELLHIPIREYAESDSPSSVVEALLSHAFANSDHRDLIAEVFPCFGTPVDFSVFVRDTCAILKSHSLASCLLNMASETEKWLWPEGYLLCPSEMGCVLENFSRVMTEETLVKLLLQYKSHAGISKASKKKRRSLSFTGRGKEAARKRNQIARTPTLTSPRKPEKDPSTSSSDSHDSSITSFSDSGKLVLCEDFEEYSAPDLADEIFEIDRELFLAMSPRDFFTIKTVSAPFRQFIDFGDRIKQHVTCSLLVAHMQGDALPLAKKWATVGALLLKSHDFFGAAHVATGLSDMALQRLSILDRLDEKSKKAIEKINYLLDSKLNYSYYRAIVKKLESALYIPLSSIEKSDFAKLEEGGARYVRTELGFETLNMDKIRRFSEFVNDYKKLQAKLTKSKRSKRSNPKLRMFLYNLPSISEHVARELSYSVKPCAAVDYENQDLSTHFLYWGPDQLHAWFICNDLSEERTDALFDKVVDGISLYLDFLKWKDTVSEKSWRNVVYHKLNLTNDGREKEHQQGEMPRALVTDIVELTKSGQTEVDPEHIWIFWLFEKNLDDYILDFRERGITSALLFCGAIDAHLGVHPNRSIKDILNEHLNITKVGHRGRFKNLYEQLCQRAG